VGVLVLASACGSGEISDSREAPRLGPGASGDSAVDQPANDAPANDAPATSSNWWETVTKPNASNTGPNCTGRAGCPNATLLPGNAPPETVTQDGATYENFIMTNPSGSIKIRARNVTFRNFYISHDNYVGLFVEDTPNANFLMEYGEIVGGDTCTTHLDGNGFTARYTKFHTCDDILQTNNSVGSNGPVLVEDSYWYDANGGHGDIIMVWPEQDADTTFRHNVLVGGSTSILIDDVLTAPAVLRMEENWMYGNTDRGGTAFHVYCDVGGGGTRIIRNNLFDRNFNYGPFDSDECTVGEGNFYESDLSPVPYR
jgi:hypothetical protein